MKTIVLACCAFALAGFAAHAASVDDIIEMNKKGEPEAKQIAAVDATPGDMNVGAGEVLRLRDAKVPEKVILAMLRHVAADTKTAAANPAPTAPVAPVTPEKPIALPPPVADGQRALPAVQNGLQSGTLTIENLDDRPWAYMYEPAIQTIWIAPPSRGSAVNGHESTTLSMRVGTYKIRFLGVQDEGLPMTVYGGERSAINLSRVSADGNDTLNASIFERGERKASGKLAALNQLPPPDTAVVNRYVEAPVYYTNPPVYYYGPSYYYGRGYYPYYGGSSFNLGINIGGGRGGYYGGHRH